MDIHIPDKNENNALRRETKDGRMKEIIRDLAVRFVQRESNHTSLITITKVDLDGKMAGHATVFFTVLPENKEEVVLDFLKRKRSEFREFVTEESRLFRIPFFDFEIDGGEKNRQRIDDLSRKS